MDEKFYDDIRYGTNIIPEEEYIQTLITIADVASDMVVKTLGPYGKTTMLNDGVDTYPTKDGWNVLNSLRFSDPVYNTLYSVLKKISFDMVSVVGDGTTGGFVGAVRFMHNILAYIEGKNLRQKDVINMIQHVGNKIIEKLENSEYVKTIDPSGDFREIENISMVASNENKELSQIIRKIYQDTKNPNIYVTIDPGSKLTYEIQKGYKLDCNPIMQMNYINTDDQTYLQNNPSMIMIFDHTVNYQEHNQLISAISQYANMIGETVFILAPHFDDVLSHVIGSSIESMIQQQKVPNIMLIQVPLSNNAQRDYLSDLVLLTNAQVMDYGKVRAFNVMVHNMTHQDDKIEDALLNSAQYHFETTQDLIESCMGHMRRVIIGRKYLLLQEYESIVNQKVYKEKMKMVEEVYKEEKAKAEKSSTPLLNSYLAAYQHYTKLHGNLGVIKVGGISDLEKKFLKDTVDDAVLACRSAYENGYITGLNLTTLWTIHDMNYNDTHMVENELYDDILKIFYVSIFYLTMDVLRNELEDDTDGINVTIINKDSDNQKVRLTYREIINKCVDEKSSYNIITRTIKPDEHAEIVNSVKTDVEMIRAIVSILSTVLTSNQFLTVNRSFDRVTGLKQREETIRKSKADDASAVAEAVIDKIITKLPNIDLEVNI